MSYRSLHNMDPGMVQKYVGTSYDVLKKIHDNLDFLVGNVGRQDAIMDQLFYRYVAAGNQTAFNGVDNTGRLMAVPGSAPIVYINLIRQDVDTYTVSGDGTSVTFNSGVAADAIVQIASFAFNEDGTMYHSGVMSNTDLIQYQGDIQTLYDATVILESTATTKASEASTDRAAVAADVILTDADTTATAADVTSTNADVVTTNANAASTAQDASDTASNLVATNQDTLDTAADLAATTQDVIDTAASETAAASAASAASTSESNAATSETNAAASFTNFNDRYLGGKVGDPVEDNDGDVLVEGTLYFNETDKSMFVYEGAVWVAAYASITGAALKASNGSDFTNKGTVRTNIGLGTAATTDASDYATAAQGSTADSAIQSSEVGSTVQAFDAILDGTTASYTSEEETKLAGIETAATADQNGSQIKTAYEAEADTNAFTNADATKLDGIEASANVTDTVNVTSAGALMDSEIENLASVKAFNTDDYATAAQGALADDAAPLDSPLFTGTPTVPTAEKGTSTTQAASTEFVLENAPSDPVGNIIFSADTAIPSGTLRTDGAVYLQSAYPTLFEVIGLADYLTVVQANLPSDPSGQARGVSISRDDSYLYVVSSTAPYLFGWSRDAVGIPTKLPDPTTGASYSHSVDTDADGTYIVTTNTSPENVYFWKRTGTAIDKLDDPVATPGSNTNDCSITPDAIYAAVATISAPYLVIYKRSGEVWTKLADPSNLPTGAAKGIALSDDGVYLSVAHTTSPFITNYKRTGDTFAKLPDPAVLPETTGGGKGVSFSPDGIYLTHVGYSSSGQKAMKCYKRTGDDFEEFGTIESVPTFEELLNVSYTSDGFFLNIASTNSPYVLSYKRVGDVFKKLNTITGFSNIVYDAVGSKNNWFTFGASGGSPYVISGKNYTYNANTEFVLPTITHTDTNVLIKAE